MRFNLCPIYVINLSSFGTIYVQGHVEEEKVDSFNAPYYAPCIEELQLEIEKEGSFNVEAHEAYEIDWDGEAELHSDSVGTTMSCGERVARTIRAVVESMLKLHFGSQIMDELFRRFGKLVEDHLSKSKTKYIDLVLTLVRQD